MATICTFVRLDIKGFRFFSFGRYLSTFINTHHHYLIGHSGHSDGETPGLIPNPADKPASVPYCTELREHLGTKDRCYARNPFRKALTETKNLRKDHRYPLAFLLSNRSIAPLS